MATEYNNFHLNIRIFHTTNVHTLNGHQSN